MRRVPTSTLRRALAALLLAALLLAALGGCSTATSRLPAELERRLDAEHVVRREDDAHLRYTRGIIRRQWDEGVASIVLTRETVLIHKNERVLLEITPRNRGRYRVHRDHDRVSIGSALPTSRASWSFRPRDGDAEGWARDLRATLRGTAAADGADSDSTGP